MVQIINKEGRKYAQVYCLRSTYRGGILKKKGQPSGLHIYLDHGYKRHHSLHVFLQFRQGSQLTRYHFVVWQGPVVGLDRPQEDRVNKTETEKSEAEGQIQAAVDSSEVTTASRPWRLTL